MAILMSTSFRIIALTGGILCLIGGGVAARQPPPGRAGAPGASGASGGVGRGSRQPDPFDFGDHTGWSELFNGKTLDARLSPRIGRRRFHLW